MCSNCAFRSGCEDPSLVLRLAWRLYFWLPNNSATSVWLTSCPCRCNSSASLRTLLHVHRNADSGSPRVNGSTRFSNLATAPGPSPRSFFVLLPSFATASRRSGIPAVCGATLRFPHGWHAVIRHSRVPPARFRRDQLPGFRPPPIVAASARRERARSSQIALQSRVYCPRNILQRLCFDCYTYFLTGAKVLALASTAAKRSIGRWQ
jgi:hypothetical protein